ncbi:MAG: hypothetical protein ABI609_10435 [Acidobacteriota bacterium]
MTDRLTAAAARRNRWWSFRPRAARLLPALAVLMIGSAWVTTAATRGDKEESFDLRRESVQRSFTYEVGSGTLAVEVGLEANVAEGSLRARVIDPKGNQRLVLRLAKGRGSGTTGEVAALPGRWRLELETADASGHGVVHFTSR